MKWNSRRSERLWRTEPLTFLRPRLLLRTKSPNFANELYTGSKTSTDVPSAPQVSLYADIVIFIHHSMAEKNRKTIGKRKQQQQNGKYRRIYT